MNFNTFLFRLGIDHESFENRYVEPIIDDSSYIWELYERTDIRICPKCGKSNAIINDKRWIEINCCETVHKKDILRIKRVRFLCKNCSCTFTNEIRGINPYSKISKQVENMIIEDFKTMISYSDIATKYHLTTARVIQIFDDNIKYLPAEKMPRVLCIDEIKFSKEIDQKYCCVLYDHDSKKIS